MTTLVPALDSARLDDQLGRVRRFMLDGRWRTLAQIAAGVDAPEASVSARLRTLRLPKHGGWIVERERVPGERGLWRYRLLPGSRGPQAAFAFPKDAP